MRHGSGKYISTNGDYSYGGWVYGKRDGIIFESVKQSENWSLKIYARNQLVKLISSGEKSTPDIWSGYHKVIDKVHGKTNLRFVDTEFKN